ncbi:MAG: glycine--tRNA ligase subunit beta, partial [Gammaproteobacteria bacterium]
MGGRDLLLEVGTEELPPRALRRLRDALAAALVRELDEAGLAHGAARAFATPRRLAVLVEEVARRQPDREELRRGPALQAAFDAQGRPTRAAEGFARSCGVAVEALERLETEKGAWLAFRRVVPGRPAAELLPELAGRALRGLPLPRAMRWGALEEAFVRPVHWLVLLYGEEALPLEAFGVRAGAATRGHRFHHPGPIALAEPAVYEPLLETEGKVIPDLDRRLAAVRGQVAEAAARAGGEARLDPALLEEVAALVEWPVALTGAFEERYLALPEEVLVSVLQGHQRYFPVQGPDGGLLPRFVAVANIESREPALVRAGNERVIRPRLADAAFFWEVDRRRSLEERLPALREVVFQERLGSLWDKSERLQVLAGEVAARLGPEADPELARRAARLAKCDLLTEMVGEFPELQGVMGRHYALAEGLPEELAWALEEQYLPRQAGDRLPRTPTGQALAVADRLDTLVGVHAVGLGPTGEKDPYGLRRAALGLLRILIEGERDLDLEGLLELAARAYAEGPGARPEVPAAEAVGPVFDFVMERLRAYYLDRGIPVEVFEAVRARRPTRPLDFHRRVEGVEAFRHLPEAQALAAAEKRIRNILRRAAEPVPPAVEEALLQEPAERELHRAVGALEGE